MALNSGKILMRRGQEVNFDPNKMIPGEWAVSLDSKYVRMCFSPGVCIRMATYEAFEADMEQIREILAECQTVEEAVQRIYEDIKDVAVDVERIEAAAASALESEENALNSANLAVQSAETAMQKAEEAEESANIASTKAEQATEGASTATQKASEAAESADNVRNMSEVSQSYAVGGTGTREGEDTDNAKYYNQQASDNADRAEAAADRASAVADVGVATTEKAGLVKPDGDTIRVDPDGTIHADRGTTSYSDLENKPIINDVELNGNKSLDELGIASKEALEETDNKVNIIIENAELRFKETASGENIHLDDSADSKLVEFGLYGKAAQNGAPTPQNPVDIEVAGSGGNVEVKSVGKNLIPYPYYETTKTADGITINDNGDGTLGISGTSTSGIAKYRILNLDATVEIPLQSQEYKLTWGDTINPRIDVVLTKIDGTTQALYGTSGSITINNTNGEYVGISNMYVNVANGQTVSNALTKPMLRLASDTDNTWEQYKGKVATIPTPNGLAGIPVDSGGNYTDSNGQQWICDEIVKYADGSGEFVQRVGKVAFNGSETWGKSSNTNNNTYYTSVLDALKVSDTNSNHGMLCNRFVERPYSNHGEVACCSYGNPNNSKAELRISVGLSSSLTTVDLFKNWLSSKPTNVYYKLAEPIHIPLTAEQLAEIEKLSTFYPVTNISNDFDCGMKVKYIVDSKNYIDNQLAIQAKLQEEALLNMLLLMPEEVQASMIEKDTNNLLNESEV